ncbi:hypothetical protein [Fusobacterium hwasookii]|uniref:hypothetical protein n=1 Tax=Fusobacterium hwasookii TaxID=1583098 RepID=UPI0028EE0796|nr:hypothetical protein [Fusobacterium hwasookii]
MDKAEEILIESRKKIKEEITNLELKMEVIQENLEDTKNAIGELKNIFIKIDEKIKELKK